MSFGLYTYEFIIVVEDYPPGSRPVDIDLGVLG
jgi:hypothetical protein